MEKILRTVYPTKEQVELAYPHELQEWHEQLPIPLTTEERVILDLIFERYHDTLINHNW